MSAHAYLPPSGAGAWVKCAFWPTMNARYPELESTPQSMEGTAAHWVASEMMEGRDVVVGQVSPEGYVIDEEMLESAWLYCTDIDSVSGKPFIEQRVEIPYVHERNWGTPDCYKYNLSENRLTVWDYKYGYGHVEVYENWQLIDYACGILSDLLGTEDQWLTVDLRVVQPRSFHRDGPVRSWVVKAIDLRAHFNILKNAAGKASLPEPESLAGLHCGYCPGRHACSTLQKAALNIVDRASIGVAIDLDPTSLGLELRNLNRAAKILQARITGLEAEVEAKLRRGERVPYFELQQNLDRLKWINSAQEVFALGDMMGVDLRKPQEPITPTQAKKLIDESVINVYSERPKGAMKLIAVNELTARKIFGQN